MTNFFKFSVIKMYQGISCINFLRLSRRLESYKQKSGEYLYNINF